VKITGIILAIYLVLLASVPCCAFDNCPDDKAEQDASHEKGDKDCGNCSPFFNCEGCATAAIAFEPLSIQIAPLTEVIVYSMYREASLPTIHSDVWQPPKIS